MNVTIEPSWKAVLKTEFEKDYFKSLTKTIREKYLSTTVYPPPQLIFNAFAHCPFTKVKVVILGQDPYHGPGQAIGLSFSVPDGVRPPPSLKNIYKEIDADLGIGIPASGNLERWAEQGVLLLNATLSVEQSKPGSHQGLGWEQFTDAVIQTISEQKEHVVFMLWGRYAQEKGKTIDRTKHLVLEAPHPSPFSAHSGFFGCKHFSKTNEYLSKHNLLSIDW
ncbi:MAG: uracil-DNA glycosylase [Patescibacteria group bacterium]